MACIIFLVSVTLHSLYCILTNIVVCGKATCRDVTPWHGWLVFELRYRR